MKHLHILILSLLLTVAPMDAGWFSHNEEKQRRIEVEQQLDLQRKSTDDWQIVAGALVIGAIILFTVGTALGSKTRRDGAHK